MNIKKFLKNNPLVTNSINIKYLKIVHEITQTPKKILKIVYTFDQIHIKIIWRPPSLSGLTPIIFSLESSHYGSEASIYSMKFQ